MRTLVQKFLGIRGMHWIATRLGGRKLRAMGFDEKYRNGDWNFQAESPELVELVEKYSAGGRVLALGCGTGAIVATLNPGSYKSFLGVDLSPKALAIANKQSNGKIKFELGDMLQYEFTSKFDVVLFSDSIYYAPAFKRKKLLDKIVRNLTERGRVIVAIAQPERYESILQMIRQNFTVDVDRKVEGQNRQMTVFR